MADDHQRSSPPEKEKALKFGLKYRWRVIPRHAGDDAEPIVNGNFQVLTKEEIAQLSALKPFVESTATADLLLAAASYEAYGVYDESLRLYERLAEFMPEEANFHAVLFSYYDRTGQKDLARKERDRAKQLGFQR